MKKVMPVVIIIALPFLVLATCIILFFRPFSIQAVNIVSESSIQYNGHTYYSFSELKYDNKIIDETDLFSWGYTISSDLVRMKDINNYKKQYFSPSYYISLYDSLDNPLCIAQKFNSIRFSEGFIYYLRDDFSYDYIPTVFNSEVSSIQIVTYGSDNPTDSFLEELLKEEVVAAIKNNDKDGLLQLLPKNESTAFIMIRYSDSPFIQRYGNYYDETLNIFVIPRQDMLLNER